jgi:uncharacterized membrane protein
VRYPLPNNNFFPEQKFSYFSAMDLKKLFGTVLTLLGIGGLVYAAILFGNSTGTTKALIVYGVLGAIFFFSGIGLIRTTKSQE